MAEHLRIGVIIGGVEGWPQLEMLRELGCRFAQGFLLAMPTAGENCAQFLSDKPLRLRDVGSDVLAGSPAEEALTRLRLDCPARRLSRHENLRSLRFIRCYWTFW